MSRAAEPPRRVIAPPSPRGRARARPVAVVAVVVAALAASGPPARGQEGLPEVGTRVVQRESSFTLKVGREEVELKTVIHFYKVKIIDTSNPNGWWLWLRAEGSGLEGWAKPGGVVPVDQAIGFFTDRIRANPSDVHAYSMRGMLWRDKGELDIALGDYNEAIRLDTNSAYVYHNCGIAWRDKGEHDRAIADYGEAIRLDPKDASAYHNRGIAWRDKGEHDRAIADYGEAIRLDPKDASAYGNRAFTRLTMAGEVAAEDVRRVIELERGKGEMPVYAALIGYFGDRRAGRGEEARAWLDEAAGREGEKPWPWPIVRFFRGDLDEPALMAEAGDDVGRLTEAHAFLGLDDALEGRHAGAIEHLGWVRDHGRRDYVEYPLAVTELARVEASAGSGEDADADAAAAAGPTAEAPAPDGP